MLTASPPLPVKGGIGVLRVAMCATDPKHCSTVEGIINAAHSGECVTMERIAVQAERPPPHSRSWTRDFASLMRWARDRCRLTHAHDDTDVRAPTDR